MGLLVTERPEWGQLGMAGEPGVFGHKHFWFLRDDDKNVQWQSAGGVLGEKLAFGSGEIECAKRLMKVKGPARAANEPGDGNAPAVRVEFIAALATLHCVCGAAAVELRAAFAEAEERGISEQEGNCARVGIDGELLDYVALGGLNGGSERIEGELYV